MFNNPWLSGFNSVPNLPVSLPRCGFEPNKKLNLQVEDHVQGSHWLKIYFRHFYAQHYRNKGEGPGGGPPISASIFFSFYLLNGEL